MVAVIVSWPISNAQMLIEKGHQKLGNVVTKDRCSKGGLGK